MATSRVGRLTSSKLERPWRRDWRITMSLTLAMTWRWKPCGNLWYFPWLRLAARLCKPSHCVDHGQQSSARVDKAAGEEQVGDAGFFAKFDADIVIPVHTVVHHSSLTNETFPCANALLQWHARVCATCTDMSKSGSKGVLLSPCVPTQVSATRTVAYRKVPDGQAKVLDSP